MDENQIRARMQKVLENLSSEIGTLRTGRAAPSIVESVYVPVYGGTQRLRILELASITAPDTQTLVISPWDKSIIGEIRQGLLAANVGLNPSIDGEVLRISFPPLTTEDRQKYVKILSTKLEEGRVGIRKARAEGMGDIKHAFEAKTITEDVKFAQEKKLQQITDEFIQKIEEMGDKKNKRTSTDLKKLKSVFGLAIPLLITITITIFLQQKILNDPEKLKIWLNSFGGLTIFIYIVIQSITIIIAPIGGLAAVFAILALFGPFWGNLLVYLVVTPLYIINFLIARKYGRRVVKKLIGEKGLNLSDKYSSKVTVEVLILLKLLMGANFDYISYAIGFTKIPTKTFIIVNILAGIPGTIVSYFILKLAPNFTIASIILFLTPVIYGLLYLPFHKRFKKYLKNKDLISREI